LSGAAGEPAPGELVPVERLWGRLAVLDAEPRVERCAGAAYLPWAAAEPWGLFDAEGRAPHGALAYTLAPDEASAGRVSFKVTQGLALERAPEDPPVLKGDHLYGGRIDPHFGHFLLETLARFWPLAHEPLGRRKVLLHGAEPPREALERSWTAEIFTALGLTAEDLAWSHAPARVAQVTVPEPAFQPQSHAYRVFGAFCRGIGERLVGGRGLRRDPRPVYLSKTRLAAGIRRFENEPELVEELERHGVEIVYPEQMSFADQVALFHTRRAILGTTGSALHVSLFAPPGARIIGLNEAPRLNSNFLLADAVSGARAQYWRQAGMEVVESPGFMRTFRLPDPRRAARALLELAAEKTP
jgi:capsular polysaccharide biosynthesis protein